MRLNFCSTSVRISSFTFLFLSLLFFCTGNTFSYDKFDTGAGNNFLTIRSTFTLDDENFPKQFLNLKENPQETADALLKNANFVPAWIPSSGVRFRKENVIVKQSKEDLIFEMDSNLRKLIVAIKIDGRILLEWSFYDFDTTKLWAKSPLLDTDGDKQKKYLLGWVRYITTLRNRKILNTITHFKERKRVEKDKDSVVAREDLLVNNIKKWDIIFVDDETDSLVVELPIDAEDNNLYRGSTFARIILDDSELGLISKILPVKIADSAMYLEIPLQGHNIAVEKIFSINSHGRSLHLFGDRVPFGVSFSDSSFTKKSIKDTLRQARKREIVSLATLPKAIVATMGQHTDVVFANIVENTVYPTNNGASILDYFKAHPDIRAYQNLDIAINQGAAIVQIACDPNTQEDDSDICNAFIRAARLCLEAGAGAIDINMCGIVGNHYGGVGLMSKPRLCRGIICAVAKVVRKEIPIFVKIRTGIYNDDKNAVEIAKILERAGADAIIILAQTSDKQFDGPFDYDSVKRVRAETKIPIIVNGGINSPEQAKEVLLITGADAVMIGRASVIEPEIIHRTIHYIHTNELLPPPSAKESLKQARKHLFLAEEYYGRYFDFDIYLKQLMSGYAHNILCGIPAKNRVYIANSLISAKNAEEIRELFAVTEKLLNEAPLRAL